MSGGGDPPQLTDSFVCAHVLQPSEGVVSRLSDAIAWAEKLIELEVDVLREMVREPQVQIGQRLGRQLQVREVEVKRLCRTQDELLAEGLVLLDK